MPLILKAQRQDRLERLCQVVQGCRACPRMEGRKRVLSSRNGTATAGVMFVAEAPGRYGADRTGIPLYGDPTGNNFDRLLDSVGWSRSDIFVTNAVLCNPRNEAGNNSKPTDEELANCSIHLESTIKYVNPKVIATLGASSLEAMNLIHPHQFTLSRDVAKPLTWYGRILFPLYHPSPRAQLHRGFSRQALDFAKLKDLVNAYS